MKDTCRCGYSGPDDLHPCHYMGYTCRKPAKMRFYNPQLVSLSGMQMKFQVSDTWACDECWEKFNVYLQKKNAEHAICRFLAGLGNNGSVA